MRRADNLIIFMRDCLKFWKFRTSRILRVCPNLYRGCCNHTYTRNWFYYQQLYYNCRDCDAAHVIIPCVRTLLEKLTVTKLFKELPSLFVRWNSFPFQHISPLALTLSNMNPLHNVILFKAIFNLSFHLRPDFPCDFFFSDLRLNTVFTRVIYAYAYFAHPNF